MKKVSLLLFLLCFCSLTNAQEKLGIASSNAYPVTSIFLNPASSSDSRAFIQFNLVGINACAFTNQGYIPKFSLWQLKKGNFATPEVSPLKLKKFLFAKLLVDAPIFTFSNREIGFGFFVRGRSEADVRNIPYEITQLFLHQGSTPLPTEYDVNIRNLKVSNMTWVEYGINFSKFYRKRDNRLTILGGNAKYLTGINILYANLERLKAHLSPTLIDIEKAKGKVRYNEPGWNAGRGFAIDFGVSYRKTLEWLDGYYSNSKKSNCRVIDYRYKVGLSLLDLGVIRFNNATTKASIEGSAKIGGSPTTSSLDSLVKINLRTSYLINNPIWATLPTAICAQSDWNFGHHIYLGTVLIKNLVPTRMVGVQRENLISVAPRYELRKVEFSMPLTFHRFLYPQLGFAMRLRTFVLGFDNILPFIIAKKTYGLNVYFNLGISVFKNPACKKKKPKPEAKKKYDIKEFTKPDRELNEEEGEGIKNPEIEKKDKDKDLEDKNSTPENPEMKKETKVDECPNLAGPYMVKPEGKKKKGIKGWFKKKD